MSSPEQRRNQLEDRVRELETEVEIWKDRAEINGKKGLEALEHLDQSRALAESRKIQVERLRQQLSKIQEAAKHQAEDEGLWTVPARGTQPIGEAYLQQGLRWLHEVIESGDDRALAGIKECAETTRPA